ncbi:MAG: hypothetical protein V4850_24615 [Myxococcota bacterium]
MTRALPLFALALAGCPGALGPLGPAPAAFSTCRTADGHDFEIADVDTGGPPAFIEGDTLSVDVVYGGGCQDHTFVPCWPSGAFVESGELVQVSLELWHGGLQDNCDALRHETLQLDLTPLKTAWQELHGEGAASLSISLAGTSESLVYSFE